MGMGGTIHPVYVCELTSPAFRGALAASGVRLIKLIKGYKMPEWVTMGSFSHITVITCELAILVVL